MKFETEVSVHLIDDDGDRSSARWNVEISRDGQFIASSSRRKLGKAFKEAYMLAVDDAAEELGETFVVGGDFADSPLLEHELSINKLVDECYGRAVEAGWYRDPKTGLPVVHEPGVRIALMHSELSEMLEAVRKDLPSEHLDDEFFTGEAEEAADVLIRLCDYCGDRGIDLGAAFVAKLRYNETRADHKPAARAAAGGKSF